MFVYKFTEKMDISKLKYLMPRRKRKKRVCGGKM
jgi:hypothetical protein